MMKCKMIALVYASSNEQIMEKENTAAMMRKCQHEQTDGLLLADIQENGEFAVTGTRSVCAPEKRGDKTDINGTCFPHFTRPLTMTSNCDHYVCDIDDHDFDTVMSKIDQFDAHFDVDLYSTDREVNVVQHYGKFVSYWMSLENSRYVNNELFNIYVSQAAYRLMKKDSGRFHKAHIRINYAILVKTIYEKKISDDNDSLTIKYILSHFESDSSMMHFIKSHVPCNCFEHFYGGCPDDYYPPFLDSLN